MIKITNVVVATDFGEASATALGYGREFARTFGARLHVLHVVEDPLVWVGPEAAGVDVMRLQRELEETARKQLEGLLTAEDRAQLNAASAIRTARGAAVEIVNYARETGADIIIMGTHGRNKISHVLMGSVAEKVVRIAPCPVLTVRHPEHEFILPDALQVVEQARR